MPHFAPSLCVHRPPLRRLALLATPVGGTRRQFRRTSSIAFDGEQPGFRAGKCAALAKLPLAAGAITLSTRYDFRFSCL